MSENPKISKRATQVLTWMKSFTLNPLEICIRQRELAEKLGCCRTTIWRAIKQLREAGLIQETGERRHRCKVYELRSTEIDDNTEDVGLLLQKYEEIWKQRYPFMNTYLPITLAGRNLDDKHWAVRMSRSLLRTRYPGNLKSWIEATLASADKGYIGMQYRYDQGMLLEKQRSLSAVS